MQLYSRSEYKCIALVDMGHVDEQNNAIKDVMFFYHGNIRFHHRDLHILQHRK